MTPTPADGRRGTLLGAGRILASSVAVALLLTGCGGTEESATDSARSSSDLEGPQGDLADSAEPTADSQPEASTTPEKARKPRRVKSTPTPTPTPTPVPQTRFLVTRVIDGDTLELGTGQDVRIVGIDTPEVGECGYDKATANLAYLVQGKTVLLTKSDEDTDRYGRLLRYVNIGTTDAGLRLIKNGLAIARYDSRDGYGFHKREPVYIAADKASPGIKCAPPPPPAPAPAPAGSACAPGYSPCVPPYPPDVNCPDVNGPISVTGSDPHALDADGDGVACE